MGVEVVEAVEVALLRLARKWPPKLAPRAEVVAAVAVAEAAVLWLIPENTQWPSQRRGRPNRRR